MINFTQSLIKNSAPFKNKICDEFITAMKGEDIRIDPNTISFSYDQNNRLIAYAAVEGLAKINMIDYEQGIVTNALYISFENNYLKSGFYTVMTIIPNVRLGRVPARTHYYQKGKLIHAAPAIANIKSLLIPQKTITPVRTGIRFGSSFPPAEASPPELEIDDFGNPWYCTYTDCPNGGEWCTCERYFD